MENEGKRIQFHRYILKICLINLIWFFVSLVEPSSPLTITCVKQGPPLSANATFVPNNSLVMRLIFKWILIPSGCEYWPLIDRGQFIHYQCTRIQWELETVNASWHDFCTSTQDCAHHIWHTRHQQLLIGHTFQHLSSYLWIIQHLHETTLTHDHSHKGWQTHDMW